jgi:hypothetical protein
MLDLCMILFIKNNAWKCQVCIPCKFNMYFKHAIDAAHFCDTLFREYTLSFEFVTYASCYKFDNFTDSCSMYY